MVKGMADRAGEIRALENSYGLSHAFSVVETLIGLPGFKDARISVGVGNVLTPNRIKILRNTTGTTLAAERRLNIGALSVHNIEDRWISTSRGLLTQRTAAHKEPLRYLPIELSSTGSVFLLELMFVWTCLTNGLDCFF